MATRPQIRPYQVFATTSMAASRTSLVTIIEKVSMISYAYSWSAGSTPIGTITVEMSNDYALNPDGSVANSGTWSSVGFLYNGSFDSDISVSGNTGSAFLDISTAAYAVRTIYTRSSGSGTLVCYINGKVA